MGIGHKAVGKCLLDVATSWLAALMKEQLATTCSDETFWKTWENIRKEESVFRFFYWSAAKELTHGYLGPHLEEQGTYYMQGEEESKQNEANNETISSCVYLLFSFQGVNPVLLRTFLEYFPRWRYKCTSISWLHLFYFHLFSFKKLFINSPSKWQDVLISSLL